MSHKLKVRGLTNPEIDGLFPDFEFRRKVATRLSIIFDVNRVLRVDLNFLSPEGMDFSMFVYRTGIETAGISEDLYCSHVLHQDKVKVTIVDSCVGGDDHPLAEDPPIRNRPDQEISLDCFVIINDDPHPFASIMK